jgi:hypothetical protein
MRRVLYAASLLSILLSGCGLRVPDISETGNATDGQILVQDILTNVTCEMREAFARLQKYHPGGTFLDSWGVQTTLTLAHDEKGSLAPSALWSPIGPATNLFTLAGGINLSADATRTNKINAFYLVSELKRAQCPTGFRPNGPMLLQSDLKLAEWLFTAVGAVKTKTIDIDLTSRAVKENALQHQIKFEIVTGVSATPSWILREVTVNPPGGEFFTASRTRTHDLIITLAEADKEIVASVGKNGRIVRTVVARPIQQGADLHQSTLISDAIETGIRNAFRR